MQEGFFGTIQMRILGGLVLLMAMIAMASYASLNYERIEFINPTPATISVNGLGEVLAVPDIGQFSFSVNAEAQTAAEAQEQSGTQVNEILAYLAEQGIEEKDIKAQNYDLFPKWRFEERVCPAGNSFCPPGERVEDGFSVTQSVSVKVRNTDEAGAIIAGVGERGATNISSLNFTIDDADTLQEEARALAIADAQQKAVTLADQLGVRILRMQFFFETGGHSHEYEYGVRAMSLEMADESQEFAGAQMPVGEESVTAQVTIVYEVR